MPAFKNGSLVMSKLFARLARTVVVAASLLCASAPRPAHATTLVMMPFDELVRRCDAVVHGVVGEVRSERRDGVVVTVARVDVVEDWLGTPLRGEVELVAQGGMLDGLRTLVHGAESYRPGEEIVVFASRRSDDSLQAVAMSYTKYRVVRDGDDAVAVRDVRASLVPMRGARWDLLPPMHELQTATSLDTLRQAVRDVAGLPPAPADPAEGVLR